VEKRIKDGTASMKEYQYQDEFARRKMDKGIVIKLLGQS